MGAEYSYPRPEDQKLIKLAMFDIFFHASISDPEVYNIAITDPVTEEYEIHSQAGGGEEGDDPLLHISGDEVSQTRIPPLVAQPEVGMSPEPTPDEWKWVSVVAEEPRGNGLLGFKSRTLPHYLILWVTLTRLDLRSMFVAGVTKPIIRQPSRLRQG